MVDIRFISTSIVRSTTPYYSTGHEMVELAPWDLHLLLVGPIQKGLLFPKYNTNKIDHLKTTISFTLHFFPPLSGRLALAKHDDNTTSFSIHCNNSGRTHGSDRISRPPSLQRWVPENINFPIRFPSCEFHVDDNFLPPHLEEGVFHFTKEKIARLKAKANGEIGDAKVIISSLKALLAHIWRSVVRCRRIRSDQETKYKLLIGARPRLRPPLPENYFGNAVHFETVMIEAGELLRHRLGWAAREMNERIASQTNEKIWGVLEKWAESPKLVKMGDVTSNALVTSSSPWFDVYGYNIGWGKPVAVMSGLANKHDGKITVFPGAE
ncbi:uncharacterized acetyltransferase At3g50280-like [Rhododendron vialii]|uniref:uncharacterized acetyltransferase At3g50280-like n=1 Tax=Rhododendron vialii TaxID=182163 RepID=UPI00265F2A46|nr:uncharacterized acetyltransferase At3g50280-like [Rhododendron vialii]